MSLYLHLTRLAFQRHLTYRAATLAGLLTNFFFGMLRAAVMVALYDNQVQVSGMSLQQAITYTGVTQAAIAYLSLFSWYEVQRAVHTGQISGDLLKPLDYFNFWLAQDIGRALVNMLFRTSVIMIFYAIVFDITYPTSLAQIIALAAALFLSLLVSFGWRFLINLSAFWLPNAVTLIRLAFSLSWLLSGFLMPLRFMPPWFSSLCSLTPFPHMVNTVIEIYLGLPTPQATLRLLGGQALWAAILIASCNLLLRRGVRRLVILGG